MWRSEAGCSFVDQDREPGEEVKARFVREPGWKSRSGVNKGAEEDLELSGLAASATGVLFSSSL